jgi:hypothetical protein
MLHKLQMKVKAYMDELQLNQQAIELQIKSPKTVPHKK